MPMTTDEAREWFRELAGETGVSQDNDKNRASDIKDLIKNQQKDPNVWLPRSDADIEKQKEKYVQQYALRGATGGRRDKGGYSTDIEDDPERTWTRRTAADPGQAAETGEPETQADEGTTGVPWERPDSLPDLSYYPQARVRQMYNWFLERDPTDVEVDGWSVLTRSPGWEGRLFDTFRYDPEYTNTIEQKITSLYEDYFGRPPNEEELTGHIGNPKGLAGIENDLARGPGVIKKWSTKPEAGTDYDPGTPDKTFRKAAAAIPASWSGPIPTMQDIVDDPPTDTDPDSLPQAGGPTLPTAQPVSAPPKIPYSARAAQPPYNVGTPYGQAGYPGWPGPVAPGPTTIPSGSPFMPGMSQFPNRASGGFPMTGAPGQAPFMGTMGGMIGPPPTNQFDAQSWNAYNAPYWNAGQDFQAGPTGQPFDPAPWARGVNIRGRGAWGSTANPLGRRELGVTGTDPSQRADDFWRRENLGDQYNTDLRTSDAGSQMDRWVRAYNQWIQRGAGPSSPIDRDPRFGPYQSYGYGGF
jgi:hypothetical protein